MKVSLYSALDVEGYDDPSDTPLQNKEASPEEKIFSERVEAIRLWIRQRYEKLPFMEIVVGGATYFVSRKNASYMTGEVVLDSNGRETPWVYNYDSSRGRGAVSYYTRKAHAKGKLVSKVCTGSPIYLYYPLEKWFDQKFTYRMSKDIWTYR